MKLNQLGLTPAGMKATKKLGCQVHKTTVAAAMEPKLRLGVVGIEIGQEQSSGPTSITEAVGDDIITSFLKFAKTVNYRQELPGKDKLGAWTIAIQVGRLHDSIGSNKANEAYVLMDAVVKAMKENINSKHARDLLELGVTGGLIGEMAAHLSSIPKHYDDALRELKDVTKLMGLIDHLNGYIADDVADPLHRKLAIALRKKAGFKV